MGITQAALVLRTFLTEEETENREILASCRETWRGIRERPVTWAYEALVECPVSTYAYMYKNLHNSHKTLQEALKRRRGLGTATSSGYLLRKKQTGSRKTRHRQNF